MTISVYLTEIAKKYDAGISTEHTYRGYLQNLIEALAGLKYEI